MRMTRKTVSYEIRDDGVDSTWKMTSHVIVTVIVFEIILRRPKEDQAHQETQTIAHHWPIFVIPYFPA
jgi:hypothetical protein